MGYFADDNEFISEFFDQTWAPNPGRRPIGERQPRRRQGCCGLFLSAVLSPGCATDGLGLGR